MRTDSEGFTWCRNRIWHCSAETTDTDRGLCAECEVLVAQFALKMMYHEILQQLSMTDFAPVAPCWVCKSSTRSILCLDCTLTIEQVPAEIFISPF